jgi:hypothetical protein
VTFTRNFNQIHVEANATQWLFILIIKNGLKDDVLALTTRKTLGVVAFIVVNVVSACKFFFALVTNAVEILV